MRGCGGGWAAEACLRGGDKDHRDLTFRVFLQDGYRVLRTKYASNTFSRCMILHASLVDCLDEILAAGWTTMDVWRFYGDIMGKNIQRMQNIAM